MLTATARRDSPRREAILRILVVDASSSCELAIATGNSDWIDAVHVAKGTKAELDQCGSETWDLVVTHAHELAIAGPVTPSSIDAESGGAITKSRANSPSPRVSWLPFAVFARWHGVLRKLFGRERLSRFERGEQCATRTVVLAEIQREIGEALSAIETGDFDAIGEIALRLRDDGALYNFAKLSGLGAALYDTVPNRDIRTARNIAQKLMTYLGRTIGYYTA